MRGKFIWKSAPLLAAIAAVGIGVHAALLREPPATEPNQVAELAPGVYFRHGDLAGSGHCNNGFIIFRDFVLVIDANFPSGAEACLADLRKITDKPVRFVFDTHHHGDHAYGNPVWSANGAVPLAHEGVRREMARYEPGRWQEAAEGREDVKKLGRDTAMPPVVTFPDRMVIDDGSQRVELLHFGTAHTRGDGFAYLPRQRILFTGDAVVNGPHNYMGDGNTESWVRVIESLEGLDVEIVAPGHGPAGSRDVLARQKAFIESLRAAVSRGLADGKTAAELREEIQVPEASRNYVGTMFRDQVTKIYAEMAGLEMPLELEELGLREGPSPSRKDAGWAPPRKVILAGERDWIPALQKVAPGVEVVVPGSREEMLREVADAEALIGTATPELIAAGKKLRWVHSFSAGVNQYVGVSDSLPGIPALVDSDIVLTNARRCYGHNIADQAFGYILSFTRRLKDSIEGKQEAARKGSNGSDAGGGRALWNAVDPGTKNPERELAGKTLLLVGVGGIGSQVAVRAAAFGMEVIGIDPEVKMAAGVKRIHPPADLVSQLPKADVVVIACPWTRQTHHMIKKYHFDSMKDGAIFVNVARGPIVEREPLIAALESGKLAGAAFDVTDPEPLPDSDPLWSMPNVIITPHNAGQSDGSSRRRFLLARENLRRFAAGEQLLNVVDKKKGY